MDENRIVKMEELIAHQSQQIEDLSDQLAKQWTNIDKLTRKLDDLSEHYADLEEQVGAPAATKPPHY
ncbi:MAG: SlyX family protein [Lentilitoribacter sp.]|jgi:SlyX protein